MNIESLTIYGYVLTLSIDCNWFSTICSWYGWYEAIVVHGGWNTTIAGLLVRTCRLLCWQVKKAVLSTQGQYHLSSYQQFTYIPTSVPDDSYFPSTCTSNIFSALRPTLCWYVVKEHHPKQNPNITSDSTPFPSQLGLNACVFFIIVYRITKRCISRGQLCFSNCQLLF